MLLRYARTQQSTPFRRLSWALCKKGVRALGRWKLSESYDFDGREARYSRLGKGPPMVLVHGTPWSSFKLRYLIQRLSKEYTVYFFALLGYGQSCMSEGDVSLGVQNKVLDRLLAHWELDELTLEGIVLP